MSDSRDSPGWGAKRPEAATSTHPAAASSQDHDSQRQQAALEFLGSAAFAVISIVCGAAADVVTERLAARMASMVLPDTRISSAAWYLLCIFLFVRRGFLSRSWRCLRDLIAHAGSEEVLLRRLVTALCYTAGYVFLVLVGNNFFSIARFILSWTLSLATLAIELLIVYVSVGRSVVSIAQAVGSLSLAVLRNAFVLWQSGLSWLGVLTRYVRDFAEVVCIAYCRFRRAVKGDERPTEFGKPYIYERLASDEIRLLRITRSGPFGPLECRIVRANMSIFPPYEAVSYTWAGLPKDLRIIVDDEGHAVTVTRTVMEILWDRASWLDVKLLWIDSVCINQDDLVEKASQVRMMSRIYSCAKRTIIWLGYTKDDGLVCMAYIMRMISALYMSPPGTDGQTLLRIGSNEPGWEEFLEMLDHAYWGRVWIVQEICHSEEPIICYGGRTILFSNLEILFREQSRRGLQDLFAISSTERPPKKTIPSGYRLLPMIIALKLQCHNTARTALDLDLPELLDTTKIFRASDARDLVFGFLSLLPSDTSYPVDVDYTLTPDQVSLQVGRRGIKHDPPAMIAQAGIGFGRSSESLPSWCPDFAGPRDITSLSYSDRFSGHKPLIRFAYRASGSHHELKMVLRDETDIARTELLPFDAIAELGAVCPRHSTLGGRGKMDETGKLLADLCLAMIESARGLVGKSSLYGGLDAATREEVIWRTLKGDRNVAQKPYARPAAATDGDLFRYTEIESRQKSTRHAGRPLDDADVEFLTSFAPSTSHRIETVGAWVTAAWNQACQGRRVALTARGALCLVPEFSIIGDAIGVLRGGQSCVVMRSEPLPGNESRKHTVVGSQDRRRLPFRLVGESYVHGFMDGEALRTHADPDSAWVEIDIW